MEGKMAIRNILKDGEPTLKKKARTVVNFDKRLHTLLDDMIETMHSADGLGLAGPQVGVLRRIAIVADSSDNIVELINPQIILTEGEVEGVEGCLSFPGKWALIKRPSKATVTALDRHGKKFTVTGEGMTARAICHEVDHLDGIVLKDRATKFITEEELLEMHREAADLENNIENQ